MKCWNCGFEIERGGSAFCPNCGADLRKAPAPAGQGQNGAAQRPAMPQAPGAQADQAQRYVTPLPSNGWDTPASPGAEYDSLGSGYQTPETVVPGGADSPERAEEDYRRAKRELKQARKRAGKSNAPKVVAIIVAIAVVGCASAAGAYYVANGNSFQPRAEAESATSDGGASPQQESAPAATEANANASNGSAATTSAEANETDALVGTWTGTLEAADAAGLMDCYGSQSKPPVLTVKSVDSSGKVTADLKVCYHAHESSDNAIDSSPNDTYLEADNIVMTMAGKRFSYTFEPHDIDGSYDSYDEEKIDFTYDTSGGTPKLTAKADSVFYPSGGSGFGSKQDENFTFTKTDGSAS